MIVDSADILVRSGKGGDGAVTFRREKYVPKGGPNGGDGGDGGSVILRANPEIETLMDFTSRGHWFAESGRPGGPKEQHGRNGKDLVIELPAGTQVYDQETDQLIVDLDRPGKSETIATGGKGGLGNTRFKGPTNQTPREATPGEPGTERALCLELKLIADVGLIGKPNAGKSTLLSRLSRARPRVADYPFTTLDPQLGIAELDNERRLVIADLPGLIERAHAGQGLGTRFLRHIERTRLLVHVIEAAPVDGSAPADNYHLIQHELAAHSETLAAKTELVALSKMDLVPDPSEREALVDRLQQHLGRSIFPISGATGEGVDSLLQACWAQLEASAPASTGGGERRLDPGSGHQAKRQW